MPLKQLVQKGFRESLGILIISGCLAFGLNLVRQTPVDLRGPAPIPAKPNDIFENPEAVAGVQEITLDEAIDHYKEMIRIRPTTILMNISAHF